MAINALDAEDVNAMKSQYVCQNLLHKSANYFEKLARGGNFLEQYDLELRKLRVLTDLKNQICQINRRRIAPEYELGRLDTINSSGEER